jgi:hypothetical protein
LPTHRTSFALPLPDRSYIAVCPILRPSSSSPSHHRRLIIAIIIVVAIIIAIIIIIIIAIIILPWLPSPSGRTTREDLRCKCA